MGLEIAIMQKLRDIETYLRITTKDVMNVQECAKYLGWSESYLRHLTSDRKIPFYRKNGRVYFSRKEIDDWRLSERVCTNEELADIAATLYPSL